MKLFFLTLGIFVLFSGCSNKRYFEPKHSDFYFDTTAIDFGSYISSINSKGATLENHHFIDKVGGISDIKLPNGFEFLNNSKGTVFAASNNHKLLIVNSGKIITFKSNVIAVSQNKNMLALLFENNSIGLYDLESKQFKLKKYYKHSFLNDTRIAMPKFLNNMVLFPVLDGKIIVVDLKQYKAIKTITIDPASEVKNIILLDIINDTMIAATPNKIIALKDGTIFTKEFFIQDYNINKNFIYIATHDGRVLKLDFNLKIIKEHKFKFAKFQALAVGANDIYAIESQSYIVKISKDFDHIKVYTFPFEEDEKIFVNKNKIYFENKLLIVK